MKYLSFPWWLQRNPPSKKEQIQLMQKHTLLTQHTRSHFTWQHGNAAANTTRGEPPVHGPHREKHAELCKKTLTRRIFTSASVCLCFASNSERVVWWDKEAKVPHPSSHADVNRYRLCPAESYPNSCIVLVDSDKRVPGWLFLLRSGKTLHQEKEKGGSTLITIWSTANNNWRYKHTAVCTVPVTVLRLTEQSSLEWSSKLPSRIIPRKSSAPNSPAWLYSSDISFLQLFHPPTSSISS